MKFVKEEFKTLYATEDGTIYDQPQLVLLGRMGEVITPLEKEELIPLPEGASLVMLPGRVPLGLDEERQEIVPYTQDLGRELVAVGALLPQGYTRTALPAFVRRKGAPRLPLYGYAAVGILGDQIYVAAQKTDEDHHWNPKYFNGEELPCLVDRFKQEFPHNRLVKQLGHCALEYSCFTAQNLFYRRWEAGIPVSPACNARCLGCISQQPAECCPSPQERIRFVPEKREIVELALPHLELAEEAIISFGQGCEGEPSLQYPLLKEVIGEIRSKTKAGTININTNAGDAVAIKTICEAGLDSMRVSLFSARPEQYNRYHQGRYQLEEVETSLKIAGQFGVYRSLNLLVYPGVTDREEEVEALVDFLARTEIEMIQLRNLNIDPDFLQEKILPQEGELLGIPLLIEILKEEFPQLRIGNYSRPKNK
mgnify:CR=1 FL=1